MKTCSKCSKVKPIDAFYKDKSRWDGKYVYCKECVCVIMKPMRKRNNAARTKYNKEYRDANRAKYNEWERNYHKKNKDKSNAKSKKWRDTEQGRFVFMHLAAQLRARKKSLEYSLTPDIITQLCESQSNKCALTGISFDLSPSEFRNRPFAPSIDRKDSKKGYTLDNVQIVCVIVNKAKNEFPQQMFDDMCLARVRTLHGY